MEWTPARIRLLREVGLCLSQDEFAKALGFAMRTIGNAERGTHPPSLALRRALDAALEHASDAQRDRFLPAVTIRETTTRSNTRSSTTAAGPPPGTLDRLRSAVLGTPPALPLDVDSPPARSTTTITAATVEVHRLYQLADYDAAAQLLPIVLARPQGATYASPDECLAGTLTAQHVMAAAYIAAAKLTTKLGDVGLASVTADRAMTAAKESEHAALVGAATYQAACALLMSGELGAAERIVTAGAENIANITTIRRLNRHTEETLSAQGSLLLLLAVVAARRGDQNSAQRAIRDAGQLAEQLGCDSNWLWTAFGPTNVAIHQLSVQSQLGNAKKAVQIAETIDTDAMPVVLRGRRSRIHLELGWAAAKQADDAVAVLHLLEVERVAEQAVSRSASARTLLGMLMARERRSVTPGLQGLASRAGVLT
ncbi:MAG: helix-turn-helix domain-containing protein [Pseudonocardiaceae bacterium]